MSEGVIPVVFFLNRNGIATAQLNECTLFIGICHCNIHHIMHAKINVTRQSVQKREYRTAMSVRYSKC